jgi:hypothetical protein
MIIKHSLDFETVKIIFEQMLKDLVAPRLAPILDELNENGSFAILRLAE